MNQTFNKDERRPGWVLMIAALSLFAAAFAPIFVKAQEVALFPVEFSADLVTTHASKDAPPMIGKVYVSKTRIRVDTSSDGTGMGRYANLEKHESWLVMYKLRKAQDWTASTSEFAPQHAVPMPSFYVTMPFDPERTCRTVMTHRTCDKIGFESMNGRDCQKMIITNTDGGAGTIKWTFWVDLKLHYPVKIQSNGTTVELRNILLAPQPDSVFEIPADFERTVFHVDSNQVARPIKH